MSAGTIHAFNTGRDNNFNLIRMLAAGAVIFSHAFALTLGPDSIDPLKALTGHSCAELAVDVFFVVSGFLVTGSLFARGDVGDFLLSRVLRIFPGLVVALCVTALVIAPFFSTLPMGEYFHTGKVYSYIYRNTLIFDLPNIRMTLPSVFTQVPYGQIVNGSLWTLPYELWCYIGLLILALAGLVERKILFTVGCLVVLLTSCFSAWRWQETQSVITAGLRFVGYFAAGSLALVQSRRIVLSWRIWSIGLLVMALASWSGFSAVVLPVFLTYSVFVLAYLPAWPWLRAYNRLGDYSYGTYIYAYPLQQGLVSLFPSLGPIGNFLLAVPATLVLAILSWILVEKRCLHLKNKVIQWEPDDAC